MLCGIQTHNMNVNVIHRCYPTITSTHNLPHCYHRRKKRTIKSVKITHKTSLWLSWTAPPPQVLRRAATFQFTKLVKIAISALSAEYVDGPMGVAVLHTMEPGKRNSHTYIKFNPQRLRGGNKKWPQDSSSVALV